MPFERRRHPVFRKVVTVTSRIGVVATSALLSRLGLGKKVLMKLNPDVDVARPASFLGHPPNEMCDRCHKQTMTTHHLQRLN